MCICQFIPRTFHPVFTQWGASRPPPPPCKPQNPGRRPPAAAGGGQTGSARFGGAAAPPGLRPAPPTTRALLLPSLFPPGFSPAPPRKPCKNLASGPQAARRRRRRANGLRPFRRLRRRACGPPPRKLFPYKHPPTGKNTRQGRPHRVMLSQYSVISPASARSCGSPPRSSRRAPGRCASRFRGNCW